jgi:molybdate transport system ATP-binding protein
LAAERPPRLSGGQQQRVALARALVLEPKLALLDEPLSALDLQTRRQIRAELRRLIAGFGGATIFVTHSPFEAMAFGDRIAVIERGKLVQLGGRDDLLRHPRSQYVAELMGVNFFRGTVAASADGIAEVRTAEGSLHVVEAGSGEEIFVAVDPRSITLHAEPPRGTAQNVFEGTIAEIVPEPPFGERVRVILHSRPPLVAEVTAHAVESMRLHAGLRVFASFKAVSARAYR